MRRISMLVGIVVVLLVVEGKAQEEGPVVLLPWQVWTSEQGQRQLLVASVANGLVGGVPGILFNGEMRRNLLENPEEWCRGNPLQTGRLAYVLGIALPGMLTTVTMNTVVGLSGDWGLSYTLGMGAAAWSLNLLCRFYTQQSPLARLVLTIVVPSIAAAAGNVYGFHFHTELDRYFRERANASSMKGRD